jgi:FkbM family methyltransferase
VSSLADQIAARAASDPSWQLHRYALGSAETRLEINVAASDRFSSFLESGVTPDSRFAGSLAVERREQVAVKRLDDVWRGLCASVPEKIYLKVDTQGFDLEVMRGSPGLLREIHALQFELSIQPLYKGTLNYLEMLRQLNDWGFELSGLFPITSDNNLRAVELDCVMIARDR